MVEILVSLGALSYIVQVFIRLNTWEVRVYKGVKDWAHAKKVEVTYGELLITGVLCLTPGLNIFEALWFINRYKMNSCGEDKFFIEIFRLWK